MDARIKPAHDDDGKQSIAYKPQVWQPPTEG
jgi:hypothetical protein